MLAPRFARRFRKLLLTDTAAAASVNEGRAVIEGLEDRIVFSTFVVSLMTDTGALDHSTTPLGGGDVGDLRNAIYQATQTPDQDHVIDLTGVTGTITLQAMLPPIFSTSGGSLKILGPGAANLTISGNDAVRNFFVLQGEIEISALTIADGLARGGNGGATYLGYAGGGGAGMGGGLLIDGTVGPTEVTLKDVVFSGNAAVGGSGRTSFIAGTGRSVGCRSPRGCGHRASRTRPGRRCPPGSAP